MTVCGRLLHLRQLGSIATVLLTAPLCCASTAAATSQVDGFVTPYLQLASSESGTDFSAAGEVHLQTAFAAGMAEVVGAAKLSFLGDGVEVDVAAEVDALFGPQVTHDGGRMTLGGALGVEASAIVSEIGNRQAGVNAGAGIGWWRSSNDRFSSYLRGAVGINAQFLDIDSGSPGSDYAGYLGAGSSRTTFASFWLQCGGHHFVAPRHRLDAEVEILAGDLDLLKLDLAYGFSITDDITLQPRMSYRWLSSDAHLVVFYDGAAFDIGIDENRLVMTLRLQIRI